jgi:hypothetical protein
MGERRMDTVHPSLSHWTVAEVGGESSNTENNRGSTALYLAVA